MRYGSVCSGIEAATAAWHPLGWQAAWYSEIEPFPCAVLAHRYPDVPNLGDMTRFEEWPDGAIHLLVGGTPCQSFSVAGLRRGLADPRGNLMLTFGAIADRYKPRWLVWENVPGVLSSNGGRDFGTFLGLLGLLGYGFAYRVLDAQYYGVAQRRRRVFVVGYLGDWRPAAAVLFESESLRWNPAPSREARKRTAGVAGVGACFDMRGNGDGVTCPTITGDHAGRPTDYTPVVMAHGQANAEIRSDGGAPALTCNHEAPILAHTLRGSGFDASQDGTGRGTPLVPVTVGALSANGGTSKKHGYGMGQQDFQSGYAIPVAIQDVRGMDKKQNGKGWNDDGTAYTVDAMATQGVMAPVASPSNLSGTQCASAENLLPSMGAKNPTAVAFESQFARNGRGAPSEVVPPLKAQSGQTGKGDAAPLTMTSTTVRRLTPRECERLQGFPDDYTAIPWRGRPVEDCPDGPRYKALGNSMAVPNMRWIGKKIEKVEAMMKGGSNA